MYSNSDDESFVLKQQQKKIHGRQFINSDSDSDAINDAEHSSLSEAPSKRRSIRRSANSDSGSYSNSESKYVSFDSNSTKSQSNANDSSIRVTSGSSGGIKKIKKIIIDPNSDSEDYSGQQPGPSFDQSNIERSEIENSLSKNLVIVTPETDDEEEMSIVQCYSPRTRRSITGRCSKHFKISDDESDTFSDDASNNKVEIATQERSASTDSQKRSRTLAFSFAQDDSVELAPAIQKRSSRSATSLAIDERQHQSSRSPQLDDSGNSSQDLQPIAHSNNSSVLVIESSDEESVKEQRDFSVDFSGITSASTPETRKVLVQPKLKTMPKAADDSWKTGIAAIKPKYTGAQGLSTFNHQKALTLNRLEKLHRVLEECPPDEKLADKPDNLKISLMPHQLHALEWMNWREKKKPRGGILADDMGLGKTLTVIALVLDNKYRKSDFKQAVSNQPSDENDEDEEEGDDDDNCNNHPQAGHTLIICPASLINQWEREIENRVKRSKLSVLMHHGSNRKSSTHILAKYDLVITTYGVISSEAKVDGVLYKIKWDRIVLDEAHIIRNHTTAMAQGCYKLEGTKRWALTGTPIQNKEVDVYSMMKFLKVTPFNDLPTFKKWLNLKTSDGLERLNNVLKPLLLRRTKAQLQLKGELQSLPGKNINTIHIGLSKDETNVYAQILLISQSLFALFMKQRNTRGDSFVLGSHKQPVPKQQLQKRFQHFKQLHGVKDVKASQILVLLLRLRQICDHPGLIDQVYECDLSDDDSDESSASDLNILQQMIALSISENVDENTNEGMAKASQKILLRTNLVFDMNTPSSKFQKVIELVKDTLNSTSDKMVIISQWTSVLDLVARLLHRDGIKYVELNGKTPIKLRNEIVVNFNDPKRSERIMMMSLMAGGVGLNLAGANHLVLIDPHWNPQLEAQAFDRVYRVGQTKPVQIYKLICAETVEKHIQDIQERKLILSENVLTGSNKSVGSKLTFEDMRRLFEML